MDLKLSEWTFSEYLNFREYLKKQGDGKYRDFHSSLVPNAEKEKILGIKMPILREIGKEISKGNIKSFLTVSSPCFYEEHMINGIVTGLINARDFDEFIRLFEKFVITVDNWAICDCFCAGLKQVKKYKAEFFEYLESCLESGNEWKIRVALVVMIDYYLDEEYIGRVLKRCDSVKNNSYYVSMARAWLVATAAAKCRNEAMEYIKNNSLDDETFNRAIQKCIDSRRIDNDTKDYLKKLRRK